MDSDNHNHHNHSNVRIDAPIIKLTVHGRLFTGLLDTCSKFTLAGRPLIRFLRTKGEPTIPTLDSDARDLCDSVPLIPREEAYVKFEWAQADVRQKTIYVPELTCDLILGRDFMRECDMMIHPRRYGYSFGKNPTHVFKFDFGCDNCTYRPSWKSFIGSKELPQALKEGTPIPAELIPKKKPSAKTPYRFFRKKRRHSDSDTDSDSESSPVEKSPTKDEVISANSLPNLSVNNNNDGEGDKTNNKEEKVTCTNDSTHVCGNGLTTSPNDDSMEEVDIVTFQTVNEKKKLLLDAKSKNILSQINCVYDFLEDDAITSSVRNTFNRKVQDLLEELRKVKSEIEMLEGG